MCQIKGKQGCCTLGKMAADYGSENQKFTTFFWMSNFLDE